MISSKSTRLIRAICITSMVGVLTLVSGCSNIMMPKEQLIKYGPDETNPYDEVKKEREHEIKVQTMVIEADSALNRGEYDKAKQLYQNIQAIDKNNLRASEGLKRVEMYRQHDIWLAQATSLLNGDQESQDKAKMLLSKILMENPNNKKAASLYQEILAQEDEERLKSLQVKLSYKSPVSLQFRDTDFRVIIEALAKGTGINFSLDKDIPEDLKASIFVKKVSIQDALKMLVESSGLRMKVLTKNSVLIYPDSAIKVRQYQDLVIRSFYLQYADPKSVANMLHTMLGVKQVQQDDRLPILIVKDVPSVMPLVQKLILNQDKPEPEVMLEMDIIEVSRDITKDTGFRWPNQLSVLSGQTGLTLEALKNLSDSQIGVSPNPAVLFGAQDSQINLLANPRIRVKNGKTAKIHIGDRLPVITSNVSSTGVIAENVQYIDVGLKLDAKPTINLEGDVNIKLDLDVSTQGNAIKTNSGSIVYQIGTRSTSTELRLKDGETQVLAGLINDADRKNVSKIPGLSDLPLIGSLFSSDGGEKQKTELVLMITPHIVRQRDAPSAASSEYWVGSELQSGRSFVRPRTQRELSKLFRAGNPPEQPRSVPDKQDAPTALNIKLPSGLTSDM